MTVLDILEKATEDVEFEPIKHNTRGGLLVTPIILVDDINKYRNKLLFKKVGELDFWNEISGWFHSNSKCSIPHPVYDTTGGMIEIPSDVPVRTTWDGECGSLTSPIVAGAYIVDQNYNLYIIYGWNNCDKSGEIYFDFV